MNREIKFRGKRVDNGEWVYGFLNGWHTDGKQVFAIITPEEVFVVKNESVGQYTGLKDKNGKEIYEGSLLRIKGKMGDKGEYSFDAIYSVNEMSYEGVSLNFVKLFSQSPDSVDNSYPITHSPSFKNRVLCTDYRNSNYSHIALNETSRKNDLSGHTWKEHHYTNDIE